MKLKKKRGRVISARTNSVSAHFQKLYVIEKKILHYFHNQHLKNEQKYFFKVFTKLNFVDHCCYPSNLRP